MDEEEIKRLRKAICRSFGSSPHKKKYWLALLEMFVAAQKEGQLFCRCDEPDAARSKPKVEVLTDRRRTEYKSLNVRG